MTNEIVELNQKEIVEISGGITRWTAAKMLIVGTFIYYKTYKPEWMSWKSTMSLVFKEEPTKNKEL